MACRRSLQAVKNAVVELVPTPQDKSAQQFAQAQQQQQAGGAEKVKVGVTAQGSEEKVRDEL